MTTVNFLAHEMFWRNGTSDFITAMLTAEDDHAFLRAEARRRQADGEFRKTRRAILEAQKQRVTAKREKVRSLRYTLL